jgi:hypothetical protein
VYRAKAVGVKANQDVLSSAWSDEAAAFVTNDGGWWIKSVDADESAINIGNVKVQGPLSEDVQQSVGVFRPLGRTTSVVISGDIYGSDGQYNVTLVGDAEWQEAQGILFGYSGDVCIQDPFGYQKIVRFVSRSVQEQGTRAIPRRTVSVGYVEVR